MEINVIAVTTQKEKDAAEDSMNKATCEWTARAARGECSWVCADCFFGFPDGMPDACAHGQESCTRIIRRDKEEAYRTKPPTPPTRPSIRLTCSACGYTAPEPEYVHTCGFGFTPTYIVFVACIAILALLILLR